MTNVIIMEGDTGVARFFCGNCGKSFRAIPSLVTTANKSPICLDCIVWANPQRLAAGIPAIPFNRAAYLSDTEELPSY